MVQLGGERHALDEEEGDEVWDRVEDPEVADAPVGPRVEEHSAIERVRGEGRVREEYLRTGVGGEVGFRHVARPQVAAATLGQRGAPPI